VGTTALAADMLEPTVNPATETILVKGVACASKSDPCRDTVCIGSFTEKRILLLQYRWGNCENGEP